MGIKKRDVPGCTCCVNECIEPDNSTYDFSTDPFSSGWTRGVCSGAGSDPSIVYNSGAGNIGNATGVCVGYSYVLQSFPSSATYCATEATLTWNSTTSLGLWAITIGPARFFGVYGTGTPPTVGNSYGSYTALCTSTAIGGAVSLTTPGSGLFRIVITKNGSNFDTDYLIDGVSQFSETNVSIPTLRSQLDAGACVSCGTIIQTTGATVTADDFVWETG